MLYSVVSFWFWNRLTTEAVRLAARICGVTTGGVNHWQKSVSVLAKVISEVLELREAGPRHLLTKRVPAEELRFATERAFLQFLNGC
jgi:hypothetical protein